LQERVGRVICHNTRNVVVITENFEISNLKLTNVVHGNIIIEKLCCDRLNGNDCI